MDNILQSIKKALTGVTEEYDAFDDQILLFINGAISTLSQIGIGPEDGSFVATSESEWSEYLDSERLLPMVKQYITDRVKLSFDPPASSFVLSAIEKDLDRLEWRIKVMTDSVNGEV